MLPWTRLVCDAPKVERRKTGQLLTEKRQRLQKQKLLKPNSDIHIPGNASVFRVWTGYDTSSDR